MQNLTVIPHDEIVFEIKKDKPSIANLRLYNNRNIDSNQLILFRIKTTDPTIFQVKPCQGYIEQGETKNINIILQPNIPNPNQTQKFQILYIPVNEIKEVQKHLQMFNKSQFIQSIIRAKYQLEDQAEPQLQSSNAYKSVFDNQNANLFKSVIKQQPQPEQNAANNDNGGSSYNKQVQSILENKGMNLVQSTYIMENKGNIHNYIQFLQEKVQEKEQQLIQVSEDRNKFQNQISHIQNQPNYQRSKQGQSVFKLIVCFAIGILIAFICK